MIDGAQAVALKQLAGIFLLPPNGLVTLAALGAVLALWRPRWRRVGAGLSLLSLGLFYLLMTAAGSHWLVQRLESRAGKALDQPAMAALMATSEAPQAIVVLGGGATHDDREQPFADNLEPRALERIRAGARLARWSGLPVLTSGGRPRDTGVAEAELMARDLLADLGVPVRWVENRSRDTADNAAFSAPMLLADGIDRIVLVTHAFHMPRARGLRARGAAGHARADRIPGRRGGRFHALAATPPAGRPGLAGDARADRLDLVRLASRGPSLNGCGTNSGLVDSDRLRESACPCSIEARSTRRCGRARCSPGRCTTLPTRATPRSF
ncbi:MAG: YdcF family protein [Burkholderiaceae bacterium]